MAILLTRSESTVSLNMASLLNKLTDFYKKDECAKYYKFGKTLGTYVPLLCSIVSRALVAALRL